MIETLAEPLPRRRRLQEETRAVHADLDQTIMRAEPFADRDRYARFLGMQYRLYAATAPLYADPALRRVIPDLPERSRTARFAADLADLGIAPPAAADADPLRDADAAFALGWLYVIEGSTLGAAFLFKAAAKLGFDAETGARGLAEPEGGRGPAWQRFIASLDAARFDAAEEARVADGARAAFAFAHRLAADL